MVRNVRWNSSGIGDLATFGEHLSALRFGPVDQTMA